MPAGITPAGDSPVSFSPKAILPAIDGKQVALFDMATRSFPRDENGVLRTIHWVDQAVALALGVTNGKFTAQPSLGNRMRYIRRNSPARLQAEVEDAVRIALKSLHDRQDILVTRIDVSQPVRSQTLVVVWYVNLRLETKTNQIPSNIEFLF